MTRALFIPVALWKQRIIWERYGHVGFCKAKKHFTKACNLGWGSGVTTATTIYWLKTVQENAP